MFDWNYFNNTVSIALLKSNRLGELLNGLGYPLDITPGRTRYRSPCPVHGGDGDGFVLALEGDTLPIRWSCFSEHCEKKFKPSLLGLVRGLLSAQAGKDVSAKRAVDYLQKFVGGDLSCGQGPTHPPAKVKPKLLALSRQQVRANLQIPSPYFLGRGFTPAVLDALDVGHSAKLKRSVVPIYDDDGEVCVGYLARSEKPRCTTCEKHHHPEADCRYGQAKWKLMSGFPKGAYLYNYHSARQSPDSAVFLVEGPGDVFRLTEVGHAAVASMGADLSPTQAEKLAALGKEVIVAFDNDPAGRENAYRVTRQLCRAGVETNVWPPPAACKDIGETPPQELLKWAQGNRSSQLLLDRILDSEFDRRPAQV